MADYPDEPAEWGDLDAIARLWSRTGFREAVLLASPVLAAQVDKLLDASGAEPPLKKRKRVHKSLLKYALRISTRCTPFGMFAGVAVLPVGDGEPLLGKSHTRHVRASGAVTRRLLDDARTLPGARLYPNPALIERADRLVVAVMRGAGDTHTLASIRATGPARLAVAAATGTATRQHVEQRIGQAYPTADSETVRQLVTGLLHAEVLLCEAEQSAFDSDPLARMPDAVVGVTDLRAAVARYSDAAEPVGDGSLDALLQLCSAEGNIQRDIHVDVELDASGHVPVVVADAARSAITALTRAMAHLPVAPELDEFSASFARYGQTLVPFLTAIDEELGIGYPRGYDSAEPRRGTPPPDPAAEQRRDLIARLLQRAAADAVDVVELTDADLAEFPEPDDLPSSFDVILKLHRDEGGLQASCSGLGFPGGAIIGRFTAIMPSARDVAQRCVEFDAARWADDTGGRGLLCGIDYITGSDFINEVATTAQLYPVTLAVNARSPHPIGRVLTLADVYLGSKGGRLQVVLADGTPLSLRQLNMATTHASANAIRLLREISDAETRRPYWSWGEAEALMNHLPAVRYRGVTLAEQRWRYPADADRTPAALRDWIAATGVSRHLLVGPRDNRLHLDTHHPAHLDLLLDQINAGKRWLYRARPPEQMGVVLDHSAALHPAEAVVTVAAPRTSRVEPNLGTWPLYDPADDRERLLVPGSAWTSVALRAGGSSHDRIVTSFAEAFPDLAGNWYFVRYQDDGRGQLRLRMNRPIAELTDVLAWLAEARFAGRIGDYSIPVYHRELERYGGVQSFPCYERLFCLETARIVTMLPVVDSKPPSSVPATRGVVPGLEVAAGILTQWLDALDSERVDSNRVIDFAVEGYSRELGNEVHGIKTALRKRRPHINPDNGLAAALREFWAEPAQRAAVMTPAVLQSASHLLCNRLGLGRHEEFAAMWLIKSERNRRERHNGRT